MHCNLGQSPGRLCRSLGRLGQAGPALAQCVCMCVCVCVCVWLGPSSLVVLVFVSGGAVDPEAAPSATTPAAVASPAACPTATRRSKKPWCSKATPSHKGGAHLRQRGLAPPLGGRSRQVEAPTHQRDTLSLTATRCHAQTTGEELYRLACPTRGK